MIKMDEKRQSQSRQSPPSRMANSVRHLFGDAMTLAELQFDLFKADLKDSRIYLVRGIILLTAGATMLLASLPVALIAGGYAFADQFGWPLWASFLASSGIGFVIGGAILWASSRLLFSSLGFFKRSTEELSNNVNWVKSVATSPKK